MTLDTTTQTPGVVSLVGGDQLTRSAVLGAAGAAGVSVSGYVSVESFLTTSGPKSGCIVIDAPVRPVGPSLVVPIRAAGLRTPVILVCGPTTVAAAVRAMEDGAGAVVEKPVTVTDLQSRIVRELSADLARAAKEAEAREANDRLAKLTAKEQRTLALVLDGKTNRQIAEELQLSVRAVEDRRARTIKRAGVRNILELARLVEMTGWQLPGA